MNAMKAGRLSIILIAILIALLVTLVAGSVFMASRISKQSTAATHARIDADISSGDSARLEELKQYLAQNASGVSQTASLTAGLGHYDQNSIIATVNGYASKAGVNVTSYDFNTAASTAGAPAATAPSTLAENTINLSLGTNLKYQNFVTFLRLIEQGLMPAQITQADISSNADSGTITVSTLRIRVVQ